VNDMVNYNEKDFHKRQIEHQKMINEILEKDIIEQKNLEKRICSWPQKEPILNKPKN